MHLLAKNYLLTTIYLYIGDIMVQRPYMKKKNKQKSFLLSSSERKRKGRLCLKNFKPLKLPKPELVNLVFSRQTHFPRAEIRLFVN